MLATPPHWNPASESLSAVRSGLSLLLLDYDGTLAPFRDDRMRATPWPGVIERLDRLHALPSVRLALVTGRSARELASILPLQHPLEIWGSHGREHLTADGVYTSANLAPVQQTALDHLQAALADAGFSAQIERKPASLAAHWRTLDTSGAAQVEEIARHSFRISGERAGLHLLVFEGGIEMRSDSIHKGHAVLHMLTQYPTATAAYLGDDYTDEDAFSALRGRGLTMLVRTEPRPSRAAYWLRPPAELIAFLDLWIIAAEKALG